MGIYTPITITEDYERNFKPTRLYVKELNGLKYFGKTIKEDVIKYTGSGVRWGNQIKKYGKENIKTLWVSDWFYCPYHLQEFALMFSEYNQIVESAEWANLIPENGGICTGGSKKGHMAGVPKPKSDRHRKAISATLTGISLDDRHGKDKADAIRASMSSSHSGKQRSAESIEKSAVGNRGKKRTQSTIDNLIESRKHYKKYTCEHCGKVTMPAGYYRWHGKYCLQNPNRVSRPNSNHPVTHVTRRSVSIEINGVIYQTMAAAYTELKLPRYLIKKMLTAGISSSAAHGIITLRKMDDDACAGSSPSS
jgi:hypothetical protein